MYSMTPEQLEALKVFSKLSYEDMVKEFNELHDQFNEMIKEQQDTLYFMDSVARNI